MSDQPTKNNLRFLDGLRGLAAIYVMIGHARWLLWEGHTAYLTHPDTYSFLDRIQVYFFAAFRYGHTAVLFFFVLSGFVIHLGYAAKLVNQGNQAVFDWKSYLLRRFRRIYPPLVFALLCTFLLDYTGCFVLGWQEIYLRRTPYPLINQNIGINLSGYDFIGNLLLLMNTYVPTFSSNGPLWSLKYEWWFYMLYPALWQVTKYSWKLALILVIFLFVCTQVGEFLPLLFQHVFALLPAWWMGVFLADVYAQRIKYSLRWLSGLSLALPVALFTPLADGVYNEHLTALGFGGILAFLLSVDSGINQTLAKLKWLGDCSYSLYILHFPILVWMAAYLIHHNGSLPNHFLWVWTGVGVTLAVAWATHWITEVPFTKKKSTLSTNQIA